MVCLAVILKAWRIRVNERQLTFVPSSSQFCTIASTSYSDSRGAKAHFTVDCPFNTCATGRQVRSASVVFGWLCAHVQMLATRWLAVRTCTFKDAHSTRACT